MDPLLSTHVTPTNKSAWTLQVQKELKDPLAVDTLRWNTPEGFVAEPYYTAEDLQTGPFALSPGAGQSVQKHTPGWLNAPTYPLSSDAQADNRMLRDAITRGADGLVVTLSDGTEPGDAAIQQLSRLLNGIKLSDTPVFFHPESDALSVVEALKTVAPYQLKGGLLNDSGTDVAETTRLTADSPLFRTVCVSSHDFHNAGATATQELAFMLAKLADLYDSLTDAGLSIDQLIPKTILSVSVGTSYFMEIAKLRALRVLVDQFAGHYPVSGAYPLFIHAQTSAFYDAATTPYTNLLRATTEAMAAVIGGCDVLTVRPYDAVLGQQATPANREFSDRVARNISVLLKEESYLDKVADPAAGSYYIETLTNQLTQHAWTLFLDIEQQGGFAKALASGFITAAIESSYRAKVEAVKQGRVLVGVTKFRHDEPSAQSPVSPGPTDGPLPDRRLAMEFE